MTADWVELCKAEGLEIDEPCVQVRFGDERQHRVTVEDQGDAYLITAIVARQAKAASLPDLPIHAWLRNRATMLVGFRIDGRGRLLGEAWLPKIGLTAEEFQLYVRVVATECDRFEYVLTGKDIE